MKSTDRTIVIGLLAIGGAVALPLAVLGPGIILDDWFTLWWAWRDGVMHTAGPTQPRARPIGALVYVVQYGVIGPHPMVWLVIQAAVSAATAVLLFRLLQRFVPSLVAAAVGAVWLLSANHSTLDHWGAGSLAGIALALLVGGGVLLLRGEELGRQSWAWGGIATLTASCLVYEATLPPALALAVFLPALAGHRPWVRRGGVRALPLLATAAWLITGSVHLRQDQGWFDLPGTVSALFGSGIARWRAPASLMLAVGVASSLLLAVRPVSPVARQLISHAPARLMMAGLAVAAVGYTAFLRYPINPAGIGDRANVVAAVGGAMVWVGIGWTIHRAHALFVPIALVFVAVLAAARVGRAADWSNAGDDSRRILAIAAPRVRAAAPAPQLVIGPPPRAHQGIIGSTGTIGPAIQLTLRDRTRQATVARSQAEWDAVPPELRIDLSALR